MESSLRRIHRSIDVRLVAFGYLGDNFLCRRIDSWIGFPRSGILKFTADEELRRPIHVNPSTLSIFGDTEKRRRAQHCMSETGVFRVL